MRHKYATRAVVLHRSPLAESAMLVALLTDDFGLVRARAEGLRKPGAKLAHALQTLSEVEVTLVRGKEGWRLSGALLARNRFEEFSRTERLRAGRVASLLLRLVHGESSDPVIYRLFSEFLEAFPGKSEELQDTIECLAALRIVSTLGLDAGDVPPLETESPFTPEERRDIVMRINRGLTASGL